MKLTETTFGYFKCETEQEKGDLIALLQLLNISQHVNQQPYDYKSAPIILIDGTNKQYVECSSMSEAVMEMNHFASDFIKANF